VGLLGLFGSELGQIGRLPLSSIIFIIIMLFIFFFTFDFVGKIKNGRGELSEEFLKDSNRL
jgi:hypothetical protein